MPERLQDHLGEIDVSVSVEDIVFHAYIKDWPVANLLVLHFL